MEWLPGLGLRDAQRAARPVDVVERQADQFPTAQPVRRRQIEQRKVTLAAGLGSVDGLEERLHLIPGQRSRQALTSIHTRRIDLSMERSDQ